MKIAVLYGPLGLAFKGSFTFDVMWDDPRGLTGSELGLVKIARGLAARGHDVTIGAAGSGKLDSIPVITLEEAAKTHWDVAVSINEPDLFRDVKAGKRIVEFWLNGFSHLRLGFHENVDHFLSPSQAHLDMVMTQWREVEMGQHGPAGHYDPTQEPERSKWSVSYLGADPGDYDDTIEKVPGRVVYCSSPDRGLHRLLEQWPRIKRAAPHAHLKVFYRLQPWLDGFKTTPFFPPIEKLRNRALYVEESLRRIEDNGGLEQWGIEICDSVSRQRLARELREAEVMAYPCSTSSWSEGFSCSTVEGCAAGCAVIVSDCDALGEVYSAIDPTQVGQWDLWRERVVKALTDEEFRANLQHRGLALAKTMTWDQHVDRLEELWR